MESLKVVFFSLKQTLSFEVNVKEKDISVQKNNRDHEVNTVRILK